MSNSAGRDELPSPNPQIHDLEIQPLRLHHMPRPRSIRIKIRLRMRMEQTPLLTIQNLSFNESCIRNLSICSFFKPEEKLIQKKPEEKLVRP